MLLRIFRSIELSVSQGSDLFKASLFSKFIDTGPVELAKKVWKLTIG
jgi:hypothetical protein